MAIKTPIGTNMVSPKSAFVAIAILRSLDSINIRESAKNSRTHRNECIACVQIPSMCNIRTTVFNYLHILADIYFEERLPKNFGGGYAAIFFGDIGALNSPLKT